MRAPIAWVRHIRAGDQRQKKRRAHQRQNRRPDIRDQMRLHPIQAKMKSGRLLDVVAFCRICSDTASASACARSSEIPSFITDHAPLHVVAVGRIVGDARAHPEIGRHFQIEVWWKQQFEMRSNDAYRNESIRRR